MIDSGCEGGKGGALDRGRRLRNLAFYQYGFFLLFYSRFDVSNQWI